IDYVPKFDEILNKPKDLAGYGIEDAYTKTEVDTKLNKKADITYVDDRIEQIELTPGEDGREIELRVTETHIQWRYVGDTSWQNLIPLAELKGEKGDPGKDGADGREIELRVEDRYIQWRLRGDERWINLISLDDLQGP